LAPRPKSGFESGNETHGHGRPVPSPRPVPAPLERGRLAQRRTSGLHPYGYTSFAFDLTPHLNRTGTNVLAVRVDNSGRNSRWYSGSGIYRHTWLTMTGPVPVPLYGVHVTTPDVREAESVAHVEVSGRQPRRRLLVGVRAGDDPRPARARRGRTAGARPERRAGRHDRLGARHHGRAAGAPDRQGASLAGPGGGPLLLLSEAAAAALLRLWARDQHPSPPATGDADDCVS
jgi:hypothetical protein